MLLQRAFERLRLAGGAHANGNQRSEQIGRDRQPRTFWDIVYVADDLESPALSDDLREQMEPLLALPRLLIEGLMCIPPVAVESEGSRKFFVQVRELRDSLEKEFNMKLPQLSMGMTQDFPIGIEEGATLVRVGTAIFGERRGKAEVSHLA